MQLLPNTHISPETAYVVDDYPYGFRLRCTIRYWIEYKAKVGFRFMSQTTNPKRPIIMWNKPKASTYCRFGGAMYLDENNHVQFAGLTEYSEAKDAIDFKNTYGAAVPEAGKAILDYWIRAKLTYQSALNKRDGSRPKQRQG